MTEATLLHEPEMTTKTANLFKPASWLSKIDFIHHLILFNNVLMTVLAEKKGGKTSFISLLKASLENIHIQPTIISLNSGCSRNKLMASLAESFTLKADEGMSALVAQINERKTHQVVIIDNAQYLNDQWISETLTALKQQGSQGYFHVCLFSDYSIVTTLNEMVSHHYKNLIHTIELSGLSEAETKIYIQHLARLEQMDQSMINDEVVSKIYKATAGDFSAIHSHLRQYVNDYYAKPKRNFRTVQATAAAVTLALVSATLTYNFMNPAVKMDLKHESTVPSFSEQIANKMDSDKKDVLSLSEVSEEQAQLDSHLPSLFEEASRETVNPPAATETARISTASIEMTEPLLPSEIAKFPGFTKAPKLVKKAKPVQVAKKTKPAAPQKASSDKAMVDEILYTIQLSAREDIKPLKRFIARNKLAKNIKIHTIQGKNSKWYILTLGEYTNMTDARKDLKDLPVKLAKLKPWIRPVEGLS